MLDNDSCHKKLFLEISILLSDMMLLDLWQPPRKGSAPTVDKLESNQDDLAVDSNDNGRHSLVEALVKLSKSEVYW